MDLAEGCQGTVPQQRRCMRPYAEDAQSMQDASLSQQSGRMQPPGSCTVFPCICVFLQSQTPEWQLHDFGAYVCSFAKFLHSCYLLR